MKIEVAVRPGLKEQTGAVLTSLNGVAFGEMWRASSRIGAADAIADLLYNSRSATGLDFQVEGSSSCVKVKLPGYQGEGRGEYPDEAVADWLQHGGAEQIGLKINLDLSHFTSDRRSESRVTNELAKTFSDAIFPRPIAV